MSNLRAIKGRLRSIRKNQQILRAMKMVSAVKLRRVQALMHSSRPYAERLETAVQDFLGSMEEHERQHPLLLSRRPARILWIVLSTDRGLCGSLNNNLFRSVQQALSARSATGAEPSLLLIGRKAGDFFKRLQRVAAGFRIELAYPLAEAEADILSAQLCDRYRKGLVDEVEVFFAQCLSTLRQSPQRVKLLPVAPAPSAGRMQRKVRLLEPAPSTIADDLVPRYLSGRLRQILFEEQLSEHSARMMMMDQASKKAADMIDQIQLAYNKLRQSMITRELADITTGVEAMA
ncbi:MAG: ATP synthase F1 subunit gamma [Lentisphaerae bacterium]|nr:ATP synthase F1 subunit gamma [Lentisphaerota bacterium]